MFHLAGTKDEKLATFGFASAERLVTCLHPRMSMESDDNFNLKPDWLYMRGLKCPRVLVLGMVLHGISNVDDISCQPNRGIYRRPGQKSEEEAAHIDMDAREVFATGAAGGSKMGINPQSVEAIPGCSEEVWAYIKQEYAQSFSKLGKKRASKTNMPSGDDDFLRLSFLAKNKFSMPSRTAAIWDAPTVHRKCPKGSKEWHVLGTYSFWPIPTAVNPVKPAAAGTCYRFGIMPECYPSGPEGSATSNSLRGRCGLQKCHFNYTNRVGQLLEHIIDTDPCADGVRMDANGNPHQHYIKTQDTSVDWYKALPMDPADLASLHDISLSNTGRAMLGMPHAPVRIQLPQLQAEEPKPPPHQVILIEDSSDDEGGSCQPPRKRQCRGAE